MTSHSGLANGSRWSRIDAIGEPGWCRSMCLPRCIRCALSARVLIADPSQTSTIGYAGSYCCGQIKGVCRSEQFRPIATLWNARSFRGHAGHHRPADRRPLPQRLRACRNMPWRGHAHARHRSATRTAGQRTISELLMPEGSDLGQRGYKWLCESWDPAGPGELS